MNEVSKDILNTKRLLHIVEALEDYFNNVAAPIAQGDAKQELMKIREENNKLRKNQNSALKQLDSLINKVKQKGLEL